MPYQSPLRPMAHQLEAWRRLSQRPRNPSSADVFAWLMDMGTGKSKVILDEWGTRVAMNDLSDLLIIAPAGSYRNWDQDHPEQPSEITKQLDPELRARIKTAAWRSSRKAARAEVRELIERPNGPRVMTMNVEALSSVEAARDACRDFLNSSARGAMIAIDESTVIKNHSAKRTKFITELGTLASARRIATGLVTPRSPLDLFAQFAFLDHRIIGCSNFFQFRARYAVTQKLWTAGRYVNVVVGYRNVAELTERIAPYSFRVTKEECLDLAPKVYASRDVELTAEQARLYNDLRDNATSCIEGESYVTATIVITQILRLHQVLLGFIVDDETGNVHLVDENRTAALLDVLEEHNGKAIVWVPYRPVLARVAAELRRVYGDSAVAEFHGGNTSTREHDEQRFKTDPQCRFMVATQGAGGRGNNWVVADLVVYYGNNYDLEHRSQSEDRAHRVGQTRSVTYVDLVARDTVDEKILVALRRKINLATAITGENYREWII